ncbi:MAG: DUF4911 domain-containing protein [Sporomusaceae bacterium]|nr:DUF4911 domain-containing protein [Sporomusaceae bacterium]
MFETIFAQVDKHDINYVNRLLEGYENLGVLTTVDNQTGLVMIRVTPDTYQTVMDILLTMPVAIQIV